MFGKDRLPITQELLLLLLLQNNRGFLYKLLTLHNSKITCDRWKAILDLEFTSKNKLIKLIILTSNIYIYIYLKTTEKLNTSQITLVEKYNLIEIVEGQVTKRLGLALFIQ